MHMPDISTLTVFGRPYIKDLVYPKCLKVAIAPLSIINFIPIGLSRGFQVLTTCLNNTADSDVISNSCAFKSYISIPLKP